MIFINVLESVLLAQMEAEAEEVILEELPPGHPDCEGCDKKRGENGCADYRSCIPFREWFSYEWNGIREAARRLKNGQV